MLGTIIGTILERSGGAIAMAEAVVKIIGPRFPTLTMSIVGYIVSVPVFCDSGFVILNSLRKALAVRTGASPVAMSIALMTGLYATHSLVPPTPGPIAAAGNLEITSHLGTLIGIGLPVAVVAAGAGLLWANRFLHRDVELLPEEDDEQAAPEHVSAGNLPSAAAAILPIIVPIVLICLSSVAQLPAAPFGEGVAVDVMVFVGAPVVALLVGLLCALPLLRGENKLTRFNSAVDEGVKFSAGIILITGAGAAFGAVLGASVLTDIVGDHLVGLGIGIWVPFLLAAALKTAQGSTTVAMVTTSAMMLPLLDSLGLASDMGKVLTVLAIGAGGMVASHANDSYFWVVSRLSRIPVQTAYRTLSVGTLIEGVAAMLTVWGLSLVIL